MKRLLFALTAVGIFAYLPTEAWCAKPYASHNATRTIENTLAEIKASGNWESFVSGVMVNHNFITKETAEIAVSNHGEVVVCGEGGQILTAGVDDSGTVGTYRWQKCRPGETLLFFGNKPVFSLYCGNLVQNTRNVAVPEAKLIAVVNPSDEKKEGQTVAEVCDSNETYRGVVYHDYPNGEFTSLPNLGFHKNIFSSSIINDGSIPVTSSSGEINCHTVPLQ